MSIENLTHCSKLTYPIVKHDETNIKFEDHLPYPLIWNSETHDIFVQPKIEKPRIGKRRELLMKYFRQHAAKEALEEILGNAPLPESSCLSEYFDNFCDTHFIPLMDNSEFDPKQILKNPLYGGNELTYYKEQFDKGNLKSVPELRNKRRPFVRRSLFTTPPELALEEPVNGF